LILLRYKKKNKPTPFISQTSIVYFEVSFFFFLDTDIDDGAM